MTSFTPDALSWLRWHHGIATASQLSTLGVSTPARLHLIDTGVLLTITRGVYRVATQLPTLESRCVALCAAHPDGFVTGRTGGQLRGLRRMSSDDRICFCTPHGRGRVDRIDGIDVCLRQSRAVTPTDVQRRSDGICLASPWRLAFDLAAELDADAFASALEHILEKRLCTEVTLASTARRLAKPQRPGSALFVSTLANRVAGGPCESEPELRLATALRARGIPIVCQTTWLDLPDGARVRIDMSVPPIRWGVEVDVHPEHFLAYGTKDRRRDRAVHRLHWQIDRVTALDLLDLEAVADELQENYRARCFELGVPCA